MSDPGETVKSNVTNSTHKSLLLRNILFNNKNTNDTLTILMESKGEAPNGEDSTKTNKNDKVKENEVDTEKKGQKHQFDGSLHIEDGAGPSRINLPGSTESPKIHRTGISKSEHSMTKVITKQDVASALKLTSISFGTNDPNNLNNAKTINFKDIKIPMLEKCDEVVKIDSATLGDLKKFMANCFKLNKESDIPPSSEVGGNLHTVISTVVAPTCVTSNVQTDDTDVVRKHNEVIVTKPNPTVNTAVSPPLSTPLNVSAIDARLPKATTEKEKKKSNSASEKSDIAVTRRDSMSSIGSSVCRICMTRGRERLISPCNCKGSLANVHLSCLERWLNQVGRNHCELCGYSYPAIRTPRYTVLQALRLWFGNPRNRSHLQSDCLIFWLLSTVTAGLLAVCIVGTQYFVIEGNKFGKLEGAARKEGISHRITETAMDFFMAIVLCGYSVTVYLLWKDHYVMWNRWRRANVNVRLLISPDANPVPFVPRTRYTNIV